MNKHNTGNAFYGRARRIEFVERLVYVTVGIIAVVLIVMLVFKQSSSAERNMNFAYLRNYLESRGFQCNMVHVSGGQCTLTNEYSTHSFVRFEDGFEYIAKTDSYLLNIRHRLSDENSIIFKTTSEAFVGYKNQEYSCEFVDNVVNQLGNCKTELDEKLDIDSYIGVIEQAMKDVNLIIDNSGYYKEELIENYKWIKK